MRSFESCGRFRSSNRFHDFQILAHSQAVRRATRGGCGEIHIASTLSVLPKQTRGSTCLPRIYWLARSLLLKNTDFLRCGTPATQGKFEEAARVSISRPFFRNLRGISCVLMPG